MKYILFSLLLACLCALVQPVQAQDMPVPADLQAAIFKKVFSLNKTLTGKGDFDVLVVYAQAGSQDEIVQAFTGVGVSARTTSKEEVASQIAGASVVYLMPGCESVSELSKQNKVFSITGVPAYPESGKASIGLGLEGGKPKIIVNMGQLKAEGQDVSADLLKLARVIQ